MDVGYIFLFPRAEEEHTGPASRIMIRLPHLLADCLQTEPRATGAPTDPIKNKIIHFRQLQQQLTTISTERCRLGLLLPATLRCYVQGGCQIALSATDGKTGGTECSGNKKGAAQGTGRGVDLRSARFAVLHGQENPPESSRCPRFSYLSTSPRELSPNGIGNHAARPVRGGSHHANLCVSTTDRLPGRQTRAETE